ncbi:syntaxin [Chloropicon primus]|uniref:Syntaxin n=1 Tax=Chloropicon primus TaxID=1764295 RepID=A0A5B8MJ47_9CHLO|nr:syntaxin [Chloropicon primus]|eukprot:QDZ20429.1 syntaxin [Chloropicon primus]
MNNLLPEVLGGAEGSPGNGANPFGDYPVEESEGEGGGSDGGSSSGEPDTRVAIAEEGEEERSEATTRGSSEGAKRRWQSGVELVKLENKKSTQWVPDSDMVEFFKTITRIDDQMQEMEEEIVELEALHVKSKITTSIVVLKEMREQMAEHIQKASITSKSILNHFSAIENTRKAKLSALSAHKVRMRQTIFDAKRKQFKRVMSKFSNLRLEVQADYKEIVMRRYKTVTGETPTDYEVSEMIESGESEQIFQKAILEQGRGQIQDTLNEIDERYRSMQEIERGLLELQQVFIDLATVVDQQSEVLDNIEVHVNTAGEFTAEGAKALQLSAALHKSIQRKKLCIIILVVIGLAILGLILWPIINTITQSANAEKQARASRAQAKVEAARLEYEKQRDLMNNSGG